LTRIQDQALSLTLTGLFDRVLALLTVLAHNIDAIRRACLAASAFETSALTLFADLDDLSF
jgi:hypothetical protein